jgi:transcriptional regulator with XRE-family HTH domain
MNTNQILLHKNGKILINLGKQIKQARIRKLMKAETLALEAGVGRMTLYKLEQGNPGISIGILLKVLLVLGVEKDLEAIAQDYKKEKKQNIKVVPTKNVAPKSS